MNGLNKSILFEDLFRATNLIDYFNVVKYLYSRTEYFSNFPIIDEYITFDDQLIKSCQVYDWLWRESNSNTFVLVIKIHWDPNYYACRTLSVPEQCQRHIRGVSLIL